MELSRTPTKRNNGIDISGNLSLHSLPSWHSLHSLHAFPPRPTAPRSSPCRAATPPCPTPRAPDPPTHVYFSLVGFFIISQARTLLLCRRVQSKRSNPSHIAFVPLLHSSLLTLLPSPTSLNWMTASTIVSIDVAKHVVRTVRSNIVHL